MQNISLINFILNDWFGGFYTKELREVILNYSAKIIIAFIILSIGLWLSGFVSRTAKKIMHRRNVEITLSEFLGNLIFWSIRILVFVAFISQLGIETSSFVAILGAAGLAVGLSLQGSLSNFAGGILIILFKPFKVNDIIEVQGEIGKVNQIQIFSTKLTTANNQVVYIPNGLLSNGKIKNHTQLPIQRMDIEIVVPFVTDATNFKNKIHQIATIQPFVIQTPKPEVYIVNFTDTNITFVLKAWAKNQNVLKVKSDILEKVKAQLNIPV